MNELIFLTVNQEIKTKAKEFLLENSNKPAEEQPPSRVYMNLINELSKAICDTFDEQNKELGKLLYKLNYECDSGIEEIKIKYEIYNVLKKYVRDYEADAYIDQLEQLYRFFYKE